MKVEEHINHLLSACGAGEGGVLEDGCCAVELPSGVKVIFAAAADGTDALWVFSPLCETAGRGHELFERVLRRNYFSEGMGGSWLSLDDSGQWLMLCFARPALSLDERGFSSLITAFASLSKSLSEEFILAVPSSSASGSVPQAPVPPLHQRA